MRTPNEREIRQAAEQLGYAWPLKPREYTQIAQSLQIAVQMESGEEAIVASSSGFVRTVTETHAGLIEAGLPVEAAARVVAAIAPVVWRANQGAAHAQGT